MKINVRTVALLAGMGLASTPVLAKTVYVKVPDAPLREGASLGGPSIALLEVGTALTVIEEDRFRLLVKTPSGKQGYIATRQVQDAPPDTGKGIGGIIRDDRSVSERRTATTARGLTETAETMARDESLDPATVEMVRQMESFHAAISEQEVNTFLEQGGLNP